MHLTLEIGRIGLEWHFDEAQGQWEEFLRAYRPFCRSISGHIVVEADVLDTKMISQQPVLPNSLIRNRRIQGRDFDIGNGLIVGTAQPDNLIQCSIHPLLLSGCGLRVLEQFFYLLFQQAIDILGRRGPDAPFLLHSSGVLHEGKAHVFCGPAGSGKSTAASLCPVRPLLSDEALYLQPMDSGFSVSGTPINPYCQEKEAAEGDLAAIYLLEHGSEHQLRTVTREEAVPRLTAEVMVPLGLFETDLSVGMTRSLDHALQIYRSGRVKCLNFLPDPGFWNLVVNDLD